MRFDIWIDRNQVLRSQHKVQVAHGGKVSRVTLEVGDPWGSARPGLAFAGLEPFKGSVMFRRGAKASANGELNKNTVRLWMENKPGLNVNEEI